jgi:tRNA(Ile)-lysidine synthase
LQQIISRLHQEVKIPAKAKCIVSVSGGADSMMLLFLLMQTDYHIEVVHFNHMKREQSTIEADLVKTYCEEHNIPFHYYLIKVDEGNFHHKAHQLRIHYLKEAAKVSKSNYIFTAHHLDDLLENVLMKITRGSNLLGYAGMQLTHKEKSINYVKPLLYTTKKEILDFVKEHNIPFLDDQSNEENNYLRNRYRHAIVPIMKQENSNLLNQIAQYNMQVTKAFKFIRKTTLSLLTNKKEIELSTFEVADPAIQEDMIAYLLEAHHFNISYDIIMQIKDMLLQNKPNARYQLSNTHFFAKTYKKASIKEILKKNDIEIEVKNGKNKLTNVDIFTFLNNSNTHTEDLEKLCYNKLAFPLILRHRKNGDKLAFAYGHKKLKDLLIDEKVPMDKRDQLWILTDQNNDILWVQNHYINKTLGDENCIYFNLKESKHA